MGKTSKDILSLVDTIHRLWSDWNKSMSEPDKRIINLNEYWHNLNLPSYEKEDEFERIFQEVENAFTNESWIIFIGIVLRYYRFSAYAMTKSKKLKKAILDNDNISCKSFLNICALVKIVYDVCNSDYHKMWAIMSRETKNVTLTHILGNTNFNLEKNILETHFFNQLKSLSKDDAMIVLNSIDAERSIVNILKKSYLKSDSELFERTVLENNINLTQASYAISFWINIQSRGFAMIEDGSKIISNGKIDYAAISKNIEKTKYFLEAEASNYMSVEERLRNEALYELMVNPQNADLGKIDCYDLIVFLIWSHSWLKNLSSDIQAVYEMNQLINSSPEYKEIYRKVEENKDFNPFEYFSYDEFNMFAKKWLPSKESVNQTKEDTTKTLPTSVKFSLILPEWVDKLKKLAELLSQSSSEGHQQYIHPSDVTNFYYRIAGRLVDGDTITETNLQKIKWFGHCMSLKLIIMKVYDNYGHHVSGEAKMPYKLDDFIRNNYESLKRGKMCPIEYNTIKENPINEEREQIKNAFYNGEREYIDSLLVKSGIKEP